MRKSFIYAAGLMCLALALTNCRKEQAEPATPASEPNFELFARPVTTKTANDGLDTKWVAKDAINVFHAEAGSATYVSDGSFSVNDVETGRFDGTVSETLSSGAYDWYAFYPYSSYNKTPAGVSQDTFGFTAVGGVSQTQTGNSSKAHLCGAACPLYGIATGVASDEIPSIVMNHLTSAIKVTVTNNSGEALKVSNVAFTGTEDIVGTYYINFATSPVVYTERGASYVSSTATLSVSDGEAIADGSSAEFYIALKPFTAASGSSLKLTVNDYEKTLVLDKDVTFTAGSIKPLNFDYDKNLVWTLVSDANSLSVGDKLVIASNAKGKVASSLSSDNYLSEVSATFSSDNSTIESLPSSALVFTLGGTSGAWTMANESGALLGATAAKKLAFGKGTTTWSVSISNSAATIQNGTSSYGRFLHNVANTRFTTYTSDVSTSMLLPQIYRLESVLPSLATPEVLAEVQDINSVYAMWKGISGAKDYTVTCGDQKFTTTETAYTFTGLAYSTDYTVSVVANPSDETTNSPSVGKSETVTTGANPDAPQTMAYTIEFKTASSDGSTEIKAETKSTTVVSSGESYISSFTSNCYKAYYNGKSGVKIGSKSNAGTFEFKLADAVASNVISIQIISAQYDSDAGTITLSADGNDLMSNISPASGCTYTFETPTKVSTLTLKTSAKRAYISKIIITVATSN